MTGTWMRRGLIAVGMLVMGIGVAGAATDGDFNLVGVPLFLVAGLILHDGIFLPLVIGAGALAHRFVPRPWRATVLTAGVISVAVIMVALPLVVVSDVAAGNPSQLPRDYGSGLLIVLGAVWLLCLGYRLVDLALFRRTKRP